jgi:hypothetical protein
MRDKLHITGTGSSKSKKIHIYLNSEENTITGVDGESVFARVKRDIKNRHTKQNSALVALGSIPILKLIIKIAKYICAIEVAW